MLKASLRHGFSMMELMVVIIIIGMLAAAATVGIRYRISAARTNVAKMEIKQIVNAVQLWEAEHASYPENLSIFYSPDESGNSILEGQNKDPWGNPYQFFRNEDDRDVPFEVVSFGADKKEGGTGENKDISNQDIKEESE